MCVCACVCACVCNKTVCRRCVQHIVCSVFQYMWKLRVLCVCARADACLCMSLYLCVCVAEPLSSPRLLVLALTTPYLSLIIAFASFLFARAKVLALGFPIPLVRVCVRLCVFHCVCFIVCVCVFGCVCFVVCICACCNVCVCSVCVCFIVFVCVLRVNEWMNE